MSSKSQGQSEDSTDAQTALNLVSTALARDLSDSADTPWAGANSNPQAPEQQINADYGQQPTEDQEHADYMRRLYN